MLRIRFSIIIIKFNFNSKIIISNYPYSFNQIDLNNKEIEKISS